MTLWERDELAAVTVVGVEGGEGPKRAVRFIQRLDAIEARTAHLGQRAVAGLEVVEHRGVRTLLHCLFRYIEIGELPVLCDDDR